MSSILTLRLLFAESRRDDAGESAQRRRAYSAIASESGTVEDAVAAAIRGGDSEAFERVFREHYLPLSHFARAIAGDDAETSDVVEDVFAWLWQSRERIPTRGSLAAYLYSAVRHRALNATRNGKKRAALREKFAHDIVGRSFGQPDLADDTEPDSDRLARVRDVISTLPERRRLVIVLRWEAGMGNADIAAVLGIAPQSVANLVQRALSDIRDALPEYFH